MGIDRLFATVVPLIVFASGNYTDGKPATPHEQRAKVKHVRQLHRHVQSPIVKFEATARLIEAREGRSTNAPAPVTSSGLRAPTYTKAQVIAWHLETAQDAWNRRDREQAYANWREVLRIDNGNPQAMAALRASMVDESKHALKAFAQARGITALADALDDQTDDSIAQRLIIVDRNAIQRVDGSTHNSPDAALYDDFENYIDGNGLGRLVSMAELGQEVPYYNGRIYGRKFLESLSAWVQRVEASGIYVRVIYPFNSENSADHIENCHFTIEPTGSVAIDGPDVGPSIPIEAVWQNGDYRIAPRPGFRLLYQFDVRTEKRRWQRR